jgi:hypothetical protein
MMLRAAAAIHCCIQGGCTVEHLTSLRAAALAAAAGFAVVRCGDSVCVDANDTSPPGLFTAQ